MAAEPTEDGRPEERLLLPAGSLDLLSRALRQAHDPRKMIAAAVAVMTLTCIGSGRVGGPVSGELRIPPVTISLSDPGGAVRNGLSLVASPWIKALEAYTGPFAPARSWREWVISLGRMLGTILVLTVVGGAIARVVVRDLAACARPGLGGMVAFALRRGPSLVGTPLAPLVAWLFLGGACALIGVLFRIPSPAGPIAGAILTIAPLLLAVPMALLAVGLAMAWPLMVLTVAAEDEDVFDALSRAYGYANQRPVGLVILTAIAWGLGALGWLAAVVVGRTILDMALWGMSLGGPGELIRSVFLGGKGGDIGTNAPAVAHFWVDLIGLFVQAWAFSYFWCAASAIYLILRHDVDGTPLDDLVGNEAYPTRSGPVPPTVRTDDAD